MMKANRIQAACSNPVPFGGLFKRKLIKELDRRIKKYDNHDYSQWKTSEMATFRKVVNNNLKAELKSLKQYIEKDKNIFQRAWHNFKQFIKTKTNDKEKNITEKTNY